MHQVEIKGEMSKRWNRIITDVLRFYIGLCKKHNLCYFIAYGSAIGAARHHGIIPWDDDIDVVMPRPDYERFLEICKTEDLGDYELMTPYNTPHYSLPFAKLCNKNTTLLESNDFRCILGLYIDIFVYDGMVDNKAVSDELRRQYVKYWNRFTVASSYYSWEHIKEELRRGRYKELAHYFLLSLNREGNRRKFLKKMHDITHAYDYEKTDLIVKYPPGYGEREVIPKAWVEESVELPFEDTHVAIQKDYEKVLNHYFGDYKQLPPEEERHTTHLKAYVNMDRRETIEEVMRKIKNNKD